MSAEKSQLKIGIVLNYISLILGNLIPIFYTPIMLSLLGQSEYGLYKLSSSTTSYLSLLSLGISSAVTRYLIKYRVQEDKEGEEKILGLFVIIFRTIAIFTLIVGTVLTLKLDVFYGNSLSTNELSRMQILVFIMVCNMAVSFIASPYASAVGAHEKFVFQQCMNILLTCIAPLLNLIALWAGFASVGMAAASLATNIVVQFSYTWYVNRKIKIRAIYKKVPHDLLKEILVFSFWIFVSNVVAQLYNTTDTVMIGAIPALATTGVAIYNVGVIFNSIMGSLTTGVSSLLAPQTNRMVFAGADNDELTDLAAKVGRVQAYIVALVVSGFIAFGQPFIYYYAGKGYEESYWVAVLIMIPNVIPLLQSVCLNIIVAQNKHRFRSILYLLMAIVNVVGTWILMQYLGVVGAALMTGIVLLIGQGGIINWYYWKKIHLNIACFWGRVGKVFVLPGIMCIAVLISYNFIDFYSITNLILGILFYFLLYILLSYVFVMNNYEKLLIKGVMNKITKTLFKEKRNDP